MSTREDDLSTTVFEHGTTIATNSSKSRTDIGGTTAARTLDTNQEEHPDE